MARDGAAGAVGCGAANWQPGHPMSIPQSTVDELMIRCGRFCCICKNYRPTHLQVHHIREQNEGGTDEPDNLIAVCTLCHSDVHAATKLTRRFTAEELKGHRNRTFEMVANGILRGGVAAPPDAPSDRDRLQAERAPFVERAMASPNTREGFIFTIRPATYQPRRVSTLAEMKAMVRGAAVRSDDGYNFPLNSPFNEIVEGDAIGWPPEPEWGCIWRMYQSGQFVYANAYAPPTDEEFARMKDACSRFLGFNLAGAVFSKAALMMPTLAGRFAANLCRLLKVDREGVEIGVHLSATRDRVLSASGGRFTSQTGQRCLAPSIDLWETIPAAALQVSPDHAVAPLIARIFEQFNAPASEPAIRQWQQEHP